jgi:tRNA(Ser,Leu) C12 N-acetylase TAN1
MRDWNTVATLREGGFEQAVRTLAKIGPVARTHYFNVVVMRLEPVSPALEQLREWVGSDRNRFGFLGRLVPLAKIFNFSSPEDFEDQASQAVRSWLADLAGRSFHVRMHRRGFKGRLSSMQEEQFLDEAIMKGLAETGEQARVSFTDPEVILAVETVDQRGGLSLWMKQDREKYSFLGLD